MAAITVYIDDVSALEDTTVELAGTSETGTTGSGRMVGVIYEIAGTSETGTVGLGRSSQIEAFAGTSETGTEASGYIRIFLSVYNRQILPFINGSLEIVPTEIMEGDTSGATGTVISVTVSSGTWGGGDATGSITLGGVVGEFIDGEDLNGSLAGEGAAETDGEASYLGPKIIRYTVSQGIDDDYATATLTCRGLYPITQVANFQDIEVLMPNYLTGVVDEQVFLGVVPDSGIKHEAGNKITKLTAFGHLWYLSNRQMPDDWLSNTVWATDPDEKLTYLEPSMVITALFGGANYHTLCKVNPQHIVPIADWNYPLPAKGWAWGKSTKRRDAAREICEYADYLLTSTLDGTDTAKGVFCPISSIDDYVPDPKTFDVNDAAKYIKSISTKSPGSQKPSLVTVTGKLNYRILHVKSVSGTFAIGNTIYDGATGTSATIKTVSIPAGTGTIVIEYDRTGSFVDGNTVTNGVGATGVMVGNDEFYQDYDSYSYSYPETDPDLAVEHHEDAPPEIDSTPLIEAYTQNLYAFLQMDNTEYEATFTRRTDLRLWQKVKITGYEEIPEEWMRVVHITYDWESPRVIVTCILKNAAYVDAAAKMKRTARYSDEQALIQIIKKYFAQHLKVGDATILSYDLEGYTIELQDDGDVAIRAKGTK